MRSAREKEENRRRASEKIKKAENSGKRLDFCERKLRFFFFFCCLLCDSATQTHTVEADVFLFVRALTDYVTDNYVCRRMLH